MVGCWWWSGGGDGGRVMVTTMVVGVVVKSMSSAWAQPGQKAASGSKTPSSAQGSALAIAGSQEPRQVHEQIQPKLLPRQNDVMLTS